MPRGEIPTYEYQLTLHGFTQYVRVKPIIRETNFLTGGGFFLRRSALIGDEELFDARIRMYCEDAELSLRLAKRGGKLMYAPSSMIFHCQVAKNAKSLGDLKQLLKITWNRFYVLSKHSSPGDFLRHYPRYLIGIVGKMDHLGLPKSKKFLAQLVGGCLAIPLSPFLPYWLWLSLCFLKESRRSA
jgi:GT2 family glycosyltransferase